MSSSSTVQICVYIYVGWSISSTALYFISTCEESFFQLHSNTTLYFIFIFIILFELFFFFFLSPHFSFLLRSPFRWPTPPSKTQQPRFCCFLRPIIFFFHWSMNKVIKIQDPRPMANPRTTANHGKPRANPRPTANPRPAANPRPRRDQPRSAPRQKPSPPRANRSPDHCRDQNPNPRTNPSLPRPKPKPTVNPTTTRKSTKERGELWRTEERGELWRTEGENGEKRESTAERTEKNVRREKKNRGNEMKRRKSGLYSRLEYNKILDEEWTVSLQKCIFTIAL